MNTDELEFVAVDETPPLLDLKPEGIEALADELVGYHRAFADL